MKKIVCSSLCLILLAAGCAKQSQVGTQPKEGAVIVSSPKAGEVVRQGSAQSVQWKYTMGGNVSIAVCNDQGCTELAGNMPNTGEYKWGVTTNPGKDYTIEVYPVSDKSLASRSGEFEIAESK